MMWDCTRPNTAQEEIWQALQKSEDTCAKHNKYLCEECFDFTPIEETQD